MSLLAALVVVATGLAHDHGDLSRFVDAGQRYVTARRHLTVAPGVGYDGQFVYRLALAPFDLARVAHGITLDLPLRRQRIGLPVLGWLASAGGRPSLLPTALVAVNVLAFTAVGALGGLVSRQAGRRPVWGALLASPVALAFAITHDLTEVLESALLVGAFLLVRAQRPISGGLVLAGAALTRETALLLAAAIALPRLVAAGRAVRAGRAGVRAAARRAGRLDAAWVLPFGAFTGWQMVVAGLTGSLPLHSDGGANLGAPFAGVVGLVRSLPSATTHQWPPFLAQLLLLGYLVALALPQLRSAGRPLPLAWWLAVVFSLCLSTTVWTGYDDLRFLTELSTFTLLVLLRSPRRLLPVAAASGLVWVLTLVLHLG